MSTTTRSRWLLCRRRRPDAALRLYCFPHSGGSAGEYLRWTDRLPEVEVLGLQLPGRGGRLEEEPLTSMSDLVSAMLEEVEFRPPYAFFGHSLGALVAYETAQALRERGRPGPRLMILSAYGAAHLHRPGPALHDLEGRALIRAIEDEYGALPAELHEDQELLDLVVRGLRGDLSILANYRHRHTERLNVPFLVLGGNDDEEDPVRLAAWQSHTSGPVDIRMFAGDHFYFREQTDDVLTVLAAALG